LIRKMEFRKFHIGKGKAGKRIEIEHLIINTLSLFNITLTQQV